MINQKTSEEKVLESRSEYLTFSLGQEQYAVDILKVQEIRGWEPLRELHDVPEYIVGVLDFRGSIVPILDLRIRFATGPFDCNATTVIIVLATAEEGRMMGVVVDAVSDVLSVAESEIKAPPDMGAKINTDYVLGMVSQEKEMIMLIDSDRLVDKDDLEVAE